MATLRVRYLVSKPGRRGGTRHFWQPSASLRACGWRPERLADDPAAAIAAAEKRNAELDRWRSGAPDDAGDVSALASATVDSVAALIGRYRLSRHFTSLRPATKRGYEQNLAAIERWIGAIPARALTAPVVQDWYEAQFAALPATANKLLGMLRILFNFALRQGAVAVNPAARPGMTRTAPRQARWSEGALAAFIAAADRAGRASIGTAAMLGAFLGQREGDVLALRWDAWDGTAFTLRQGKTGALIAVPAIDELRRRVEATPRTAITIVCSETTHRPYTADNFRHLFAAIRADAAAACPELAGLWYLDLRRTAVVWLAEEGATEAEIAAVTGHRLETTRQILEAYLPRTAPMAANAIIRLEARRARLKDGTSKQPKG